MAVTQFTSTTGVLIDGVQFSNGTIDVNGTANAIILDADGDTHISAPTDDQIDISINGADDFTFTSNSFNVLSGSKIAGPSATYVPLIPITTFQTLTGAGAVNVTTYLTKVITTGADALSLADGVVLGQLKKIYFLTDGGDGTLTPTNLAGYTKITFQIVGDYVILIWNGSDWVIIETGSESAATGGPILA